VAELKAQKPVVGTGAVIPKGAVDGAFVYYLVTKPKVERTKFEFCSVLIDFCGSIFISLR
jgi:hypothetical protein